MPHSHIPSCFNFTLHVCMEIEHRCASWCWCSLTWHTKSPLYSVPGVAILWGITLKGTLNHCMFEVPLLTHLHTATVCSWKIKYWRDQIQLAHKDIHIVHTLTNCWHERRQVTIYVTSLVAIQALPAGLGNNVELINIHFQAHLPMK